MSAMKCHIEEEMVYYAWEVTPNFLCHVHKLHNFCYLRKLMHPTILLIFFLIIWLFDLDSNRRENSTVLITVRFNVELRHNTGTTAFICNTRTLKIRFEQLR